MRTLIGIFILALLVGCSPTADRAASDSATATTTLAQKTPVANSDYGEVAMVSLSNDTDGEDLVGQEGKDVIYVPTLSQQWKRCWTWPRWMATMSSTTWLG